MFKTKKISVDSIGSGGGSRTVNLRIEKEYDRARSSRASASRIHTSRSLKYVPDEYRTLERKKSRGWGFLMFLFALFIVSAAGFMFLTNRQPQFVGDSVTMEVEAPTELVSGQEIVFRIRYQNADAVGLKSASLDVQWPDGFYFDTSSQKPSSDAATTWHLGPLDAGQTKTLEIKGQLVGLKNARKRTIFRLSYRPENINSEFEVERTIETLITDAQIDIQHSAAEKVLAGAPTEFQTTIINVTSEQLEDIEISLDLPKDFMLVSSQPELTDGRYKGSLASGKPLTISIKARVAEDAGGSQAWVINISETVNGSRRRLLVSEIPVTVVRPDFTLDLKINGASDNVQSDYNKALNYQLKVVNRSDSSIEGVRITVLMDSAVLDRKTLQTSGMARDNSIIWTKDQLPDLGRMEAGSEIILSWVVNTLERGTNAGRATVDTVVTLEIEGLEGWQKNSQVYVVNVGQGLVFNQGLYWHLAGQTVGRGNLPPVTNERTEYLVIWSLDSGSQDYDTVSVSAFLPPKVSFVSVDDADEGTVKYDEETRRLEWQINNFSTKLLPLQASLYLKLVPLDEDLDTVMTVLNPATVVASGRESFQSKSFALTTAQVVTTQTGDVGTVVE